MRRLDEVQWIGYKEVYILRIALIHVHYSIYFHCLLLLLIHVLSLDKLGDLLMYLELSAIRCISAKLFYVYQTVGVLIGKWLRN